MSVVQNAFERYRIWYYSGRPYVALIICYEGGERGKAVGRLRFWKDTDPLPANYIAANGPEINYPISQFNDLVSILRYEKPLYIWLNPDELDGLVSTEMQEPVGEQEG